MHAENRSDNYTRRPGSRRWKLEIILHRSNCPIKNKRYYLWKTNNSIGPVTSSFRRFCNRCVPKEFSSHPTPISEEIKKKKNGPPHARLFVLLHYHVVCGPFTRKMHRFAIQCAKVNCPPIFASGDTLTAQYVGAGGQPVSHPASTPHANAIIERRKPLISCIYYSICITLIFPAVARNWSTLARTSCMLDL